MSVYLRQLRALVWKEVLVESRTRESALAGTTFGLIVLVIFNFALDLQQADASILAPGILWVAVTFSGVVTMGRSFAREQDRQTLEGLLLAPMDRSALYLAKLVATLVSIALVEVVVVPVSIALFALHVDLVELLLVLALGSLGLAGVGTLFASVSAHTRARDVLLPLLLLPVQVPVILATVKATQAAIIGSGAPDATNWLGLLAGFDALFFALSIVLFDFTVEQD